MVSKIRSLGLWARRLRGPVECFIPGAPLDIVGLPDTVVKEARDHVHAIKNSDEIPVSRLTVNLALLIKAGTVYDLLVFRHTCFLRRHKAPLKIRLFRELSLGELRPSAPPMVWLPGAGILICTCPRQRPEASFAQVNVYPVPTVKALIDHPRRGSPKPRVAAEIIPARPPD